MTSPYTEEGIALPAKRTRKRGVNKASTASKPIVKEKFQQVRAAKIVDIQPKTAAQGLALKAVKQCQVVVLHGSSGTGKTHIACTFAANEYLRGSFDRIVLVRPYEHVGKTIGLRPGTGEEKMKPLMQSMLQMLSKVFGGAELEAKISAGNVVMEAVEDVRGRSYERSIVIVDEAQNLTPHAMKALLTRINEDSQLILCGDGKQKDTKDVSGINWIIDTMKNIRKNRPDYLTDDDMDIAYNNFASVEFTADDIVRGGFTKLMVKVFDNANL